MAELRKDKPAASSVFNFGHELLFHRKGGDSFFIALNGTIFCVQPSKGGQFYEKKHH
jgi:hypothetical protein